MAYVAVILPGRGEPERYDLSQSNIFGRSGGTTICIRDRNISRRHCKLERTRRGWLLTDLGSTNGTWLDHARVKRYLLRDGETFFIGDARVVFHAERRVEHRPADPCEALRVSEMFGTKVEDLADTDVQTPTRRPLPTPRATVVKRRRLVEGDLDGRRRGDGPLVPLAFARPPARPIVRDPRSGGWVAVVLQRLRGAVAGG